MPEPMLKDTIEFWEGELFHHKFLMSPSIQVLVEHTVKYLKQLKEVYDAKEGQGTNNK